MFPDPPETGDPLWGERQVWGVAPRPAPPRPGESRELPLPPSMPGWLVRPVGPEPRPPRPLAPSALGEDAGADPPFPPGAGAAAAARRGTLIHRLLERLPAVGAELREAAALRWLARNAAELGEGAHGEIVADVLRVLGEPQWQALFGPNALAEVPIAATVGEQVVAGTIDRLLVLPDRVRLVDFKTTRRPPADVAAVQPAILRQMAAYAAALEATFPGRAVETALLFTRTPVLIELPPDLLAAHKPIFASGD